MEIPNAGPYPVHCAGVLPQHIKESRLFHPISCPVDGVHLNQRLDTIERRLTDTQDVMIALSEKVDQWEAERARATRSPESTP